MASKMARRMPLLTYKTPLTTLLASRRALSSLSEHRPASRILTKQSITLRRPLLRESFRRAYADAPTVKLSPEPEVKPKKKFRFFRWVWRITYLSALGSVAYLTYNI